EQKDKILALVGKIDSLNRSLTRQKNIFDSINRISIDTSSIIVIDLLAKYRAKNTFGAYEKEEKRIAYDYILKEFSFYED
ncbi:MAG TPA: hypothetical protein PKX27_13460, partial [Bacteroidales bacterium]|nr:hypothetical protein [Bacteroidales bacterium]